MSGPYGTTDATGALTLTGTFAAGDVGSWREQAVIGNATSDERSEGTFSFTVAAK